MSLRAGLPVLSHHTLTCQAQPETSGLAAGLCDLSAVAKMSGLPVVSPDGTSWPNGPRCVYLGRYLADRRDQLHGLSTRSLSQSDGNTSAMTSHLG